MKTTQKIFLTMLAITAFGVFVYGLNLLFASYSAPNVNEMPRAGTLAKTKIATIVAEPGRSQTKSPNAKQTRKAKNNSSGSTTAVSKIALDALQVTGIKKLEVECHKSFAVSPDAEHYTCGQVDGLWYGSFDGGLEKKLLEYPAYALWFPDGKRVVYFEGTPPGKTAPIGELEIETGAQTSIGTLSDDSMVQVISNEKVAYVQSGEVKQWNSATKTLTALSLAQDTPTSSDIARALSGYPATLDSYVRLSPDERYLAVQSAFYENGTLVLVELETGKGMPLADQVGNVHHPFAWSQDGRQLAYSLVGKESVPELWAIEVETGAARLIMKGAQRGAFESLTWMPDGEMLLFVYAGKRGSAEIFDTYYAVDTTSGKSKELFQDGAGIVLLNNGKQLLFYRSMSGFGKYVANLQW